MANEKRLIDYDKMYLSVMDAALSSCDEDTIFDIMDASVVDAVPVVRCRECKHWLKDFAGCSDIVGRCEWANYAVGANGYCVYGERKEGADNG